MGEPLQMSGLRQTFGMSTEGWSMRYLAPESYETGVFALVGGKVVNCRVVCGRVTVRCDDKELPEGTRTVWAKITHPSARQGFRLSVELDPSQTVNTARETWYQLYELSGPVVRDYRHAIVFPFYN